MAVSAALAAAAAPASAQVQVQPLAAPDLFALGGGKSDLPSDLWRGSSGTLAKLVIPEVASRPITPAAAALARHVLEVGVVAGARAEALLKLGDIAAARAITDGASNLPQLDALSRVAAQAALVAGQDDRACAIGDALVLGRGEGFWLRLRAYCQFRAGQSPAAQLTLELAGQQEHRADYERLMTALLAGAGAAGVEAVLDDPLDFAISRRLGLDWTAALDAAPASIAVTVARDGAAPAAARLAAAARAARLGLATPEAYGALTPVPTALPPPDAAGPGGEAALVALAGSTNDLTLKESAIIALLKRAKDGREFQALARLVAPAIGQIMAAHPVLRQPFMFAMAAEALGPSASGSDATARSRAAGALALIAAYAPLGPQARFDVADADLGASHLPPGRLLALEQAADQGRIGDTALYVLGTCIEAGPAGPTPAERALLVRALIKVHLDADARAFALEGLVALQARP